MEAKEILARLEIVKLSATIGDHDTIEIQTSYLSKTNSSRLNEISTLLNSKNYRQALYLIKGYVADMGEIGTFNASFDSSEDSERVLDVEDMLKMSPLAKETIRDYKRNAYTSDDLEAFSKNIETPISSEYKEEVSINYGSNKVKKEEEVKVDYIKSVEEEVKKDNYVEPKVDKEATNKEDLSSSKEVAKALDSANEETPLDEISVEVAESKTKKSREKVLNKYKTIRDKFAKKSKNKEVNVDTKSEEANVDTNSLENSKELKEQSNVLTEDGNKDVSFDNSLVEDSNKEDSNKKETVDKIEDKDNKSDNSHLTQQSKISKERQQEEEKKDNDTIYSIIPHAEEKFRQAFVLYPPLKESEVWVEVVIKFLKHISKNSFTERDVKNFLDEYDYFLEKRDIAKASQVLLLASITDSKFAQFILARELFSGKVLKRDLTKSFTIMRHLANQFYPEAVCDLGQFYEYGIGVHKDKKVAQKLYEKAFELGVDRATKHINRLKESSGILSTIFKMK